MSRKVILQERLESGEKNSILYIYYILTNPYIIKENKDEVEKEKDLQLGG